MRAVSDIRETVNTNTREIASASMESEKMMSAGAPMSPSTPTASMFMNGEERLPENRYITYCASTGLRNSLVDLIIYKLRELKRFSSSSSLEMPE